LSIAVSRAAARKTFTEAGLVLPVDLYALAVWRGLTVEVATDWREALCARCFAGERRIVVNGGHPVVRQRFSIAHEIGHFVLGHSEIDVDHGVEAIFGDDADSYDVGPDVEREANAFAIELLVPRAWAKAFESSTTDHASLVDEISRLCAVSKTAAWYRVMELKLGGFAAPRRKR